jgi:hypothetical protein
MSSRLRAPSGKHYQPATPPQPAPRTECGPNPAQTGTAGSAGMGEEEMRDDLFHFPGGVRLLAEQAGANDSTTAGQWRRYGEGSLTQTDIGSSSVVDLAPVC